MSVAEKKCLIDPDYRELSIQRQCELIGLPCSSYYPKNKINQESPEDLTIRRLIDEEYTRFMKGLYGKYKTEHLQFIMLPFLGRFLVISALTCWYHAKNAISCATCEMISYFRKLG